MKKKFAILFVAAVLCILLVAGIVAQGTFAREMFAQFFAQEQETTTGFYEPFTYTLEELEGTTAPGWIPPHYAIHGVEMKVERYSHDTKELLVTITNNSDRELLWIGNQVSNFSLLYWNGTLWDFAQLEEGFKPYAHPHNAGELPHGQEVSVSYALKDYPLLQEETRYRIVIWIKEASPPEDGHVDSYEIYTDFELPL